MEPMDLLLLIPIAIFAIVNVVATVAVFRVPARSTSQRTLQLAFIWLFPLMGAIVCLSYVSYRTLGFSAGVGSGGGASSTQSGGSYGDSGASGGGDSSGSSGGDCGSSSGGDGGGC